MSPEHNQDQLNQILFQWLQRASGMQVDLNVVRTQSGSTLPIFMNKYDYIRLGGWDENYEAGMVADWDFFLKCAIALSLSHT